MDLVIDTPKVQIKMKPLTSDSKLFIQVTNHSINLKTFATLDRGQIEQVMEFLSKQLIKTQI